jgi:hypothetical protein
MVNWIPAPADPSIKTSPVLCFLVMVSSLVVSLVSVSAGVALPLQEAINTAHRKELVIHTSIKLSCLIGRPSLSPGEHFGTASLVHSMDSLSEVPRSQWWTRNRKIAIPPTTPQGGAFRVNAL